MWANWWTPYQGRKDGERALLFILFFFSPSFPLSRRRTPARDQLDQVPFFLAGKDARDSGLIHAKPESNLPHFGEVSVSAKQRRRGRVGRRLGWRDRVVCLALECEVCNLT